MKIRVSIDHAPIHVNEVIEGASEADLFRKLREGAASRAPLLLKMAIKAMSDSAIRQQVVQAYNQKFKADEPIPNSAKEFLEFGERAGFVTRL